MVDVGLIQNIEDVDLVWWANLAQEIPDRFSIFSLELHNGLKCFDSNFFPFLSLSLSVQYALPVSPNFL